MCHGLTILYLNNPMSIREITEKIKSQAGERELDLFIICLVVLLGFFGYGLVRLGQIKQGSQPVQVLMSENNDDRYSKALTLGKYVASRSGTKYHLPWCSGAKRIKEKNKIWFETEEAARAAGLTPAANCPGI